MTKNMWLRLFLRYKLTRAVTKMYILWRKYPIFGLHRAFRVVKRRDLHTHNFKILSTKRYIFINIESQQKKINTFNRKIIT